MLWSSLLLRAGVQLLNDEPNERGILSYGRRASWVTLETVLTDGQLSICAQTKPCAEPMRVHKKQLIYTSSACAVILFLCACAISDPAKETKHKGLAQMNDTSQTGDDESTIGQLGVIEPRNRHQALRLSLCIPVIAQDVENGWIDCVLSSVMQQTVIPDELVVALSGATTELSERLNRTLLAMSQHMLVTFLPVNFPLSPGQNKNRAVVAARGEIISFFDADDEMHPSRTEAIIQGFQRQPKVKLILHGFAPSENFAKNLTYNWTEAAKGSRLCALERESRVRHEWLTSDGLKYTITHGHSSVRRSVFSSVLFDCGSSGEDSRFVRTVLADFCSANHDEHSLYLDFPFTKYTPRHAKLARQEPVCGE